MDAAKNMVNKIVGFILKAIDFVAGKATAMGAAIKRMRPMSKKEAIAKLNAALGERDKAISERDAALRSKDQARQDLEDEKATSDELRKQRTQLTTTVLDASKKVHQETTRANRAEDRERDLKRENSSLRDSVTRLGQSDTMIQSLSAKQGAAVLKIFEETNKLLNMCWQFMERDSTRKEKAFGLDTEYGRTRVGNTTQYRGEEDEPIPDRSNADYGKFDHDCSRITQTIADRCKEAELNKCIVVNVEQREKLGDALMKKAEQLRDYKEKFEKIRDKIASTGFGKEKVKRINSITKNLNYVISTVTTIAASMQKSICVDFKAA